MGKHTPGPWQVHADKAEDGTPYIQVYQRHPDGFHITICTMGCSDGEAWGGYVGEEEDARLIAAAPALLRACKSTLSDLEDRILDVDSPGTRQTMQAEINYLRRVIAEAEG